MTESTHSARSLLDRCLHPVLFGVYPVAFLLAQNVDEMWPRDSLRAFAACFVFALALWGLAYAIVRERHRSAVIATLLIALIFLYPEYSHAWWQTVLVAASAVPALILIGRHRADWSRVTRFLNVAAVAALGISMAEILPVMVNRSLAPERSLDTAQEIRAGDKVPEHLQHLVGHTPNIYYVVLDGYGRADVFERFYGFDNAEFIEFLHSQGFYVADYARSNYARTMLSMPSTLNFSHLIDFINKHDLVDTDDLVPLAKLTEQNRVFYFLKQFGYTNYAFHCGQTSLLLFNADHVFPPPAYLSPFEYVVLARTPFLKILARIMRLNGYRLHYTAVQHALDGLNNAVHFPGPKFVLAHVLCPHPPFVFGPNGEYRVPKDPKFGLVDGDSAVGEYMTAEEYRQSYVDQVHWLNGEVMKWVANVRKNDPDAIIVLQGDHGPGSMLTWNNLQRTNMLERFSILNAMYLPGGGEKALYPGITSVNTFRVIFNQYFGMNYEMLPDKSYFSEQAYPLYLSEIIFPPAPADAPQPERASPVSKDH